MLSAPLAGADCLDRGLPRPGLTTAGSINLVIFCRTTVNYSLFRRVMRKAKEVFYP
jgi:hypothetical protein